MKRKLLFIGLIVNFLMISLQGKNIHIEGWVVDNYDEPIIGASVYIKGTTTGTYTDIEGYFSLKDVPESAAIIISYLGMQSLELPAIPSMGRIQMAEDNMSLDEVVVVGYAPVKRSMITGSAVTIRPGKKSSKSTKKVKASEVSYSQSSGIKSGTLTSGEVNDFAKWNQWDNILTNDLKAYLGRWKYRPLDRYTAQLTTLQGMPVFNAEVSLMNSWGEILWKSRTDNTGKAELWIDLFTLEPDKRDDELSILFEYQDIKTTLKGAIPFSQGINSTKIDVECNRTNEVDLFFILDATGSMGDEMRYLQTELLDIVETIEKQTELNLRIGSLVYRDHGDDYLTRKTSLDHDFSKTVDFLKAQHANGGGDYPEAVDEALYQSIEHEDWNNYALARIAFLILDAPSHDTPEVIERLAGQISLAAEKGIRIVPVACSDIQKDGEYLMRCIALATNGTYLFLTDDSGVGNAHIKPSTDKYDVEKLNEAMVRIVKQYTQMPDCDSDEWEKENMKTKEKFIPNPYDEDEKTKKADKLTEKDILKIYPNPCTDFLKVEVKRNVQDMYLVDMTGKVLKGYKPGKTEVLEIDVKPLPTGVYFIKIFCQGRWFTEKVIVK